MTTLVRPIRTYRPLVPVSIWLIGALIFFRRAVFSNFRYINGDIGDGRLIVYLHEHWIQVLRGASSWRSPEFFYPEPNTLGYSDTFILDEIFYAPLRLLGLDVFLAYQWTLIALTAVGFTGVYHLTRRVLPGQRLICSMLAAMFAFSNMMFVQSGHTQLYAVYWLPVVALLVLRVRRRDRSGGVAFLTGLLVGLLFLSTYYVPWFAAVCTVGWLLITGILRLAGGARPSRPVTVAAFLAWRFRIVMAGLGAAIGLIPFLVIYLPTLGFGSRTYADAMGFASSPKDIFNTGRQNYLWSALARATTYGPGGHLDNGEFGFALTPLTLLALGFGLVYVVYRVLADRASDAAGRTALSTALVAVSAIVLPMKVHGYSLWYFVWHLVPGAQAIRAIDRIGVIAGLLTPIVIAYVLADILRRRTGRPWIDRQRVSIAMAVIALLAAEQYNHGNNAGINRTSELATLWAVPSPPHSCRAFFVLVPTKRPPAAFASSIDAMLISQYEGIPTINGYSGQIPPDYLDVDQPGSPDYQLDVDAWADTHGLQAGLCSYGLDTHQWLPVRP